MYELNPAKCGRRLIASAAVALALVACSSTEEASAPSTTAASSARNVTASSALWAFNTADQRELAGANDSIFVGTVTEQLESESAPTSVDTLVMPRTQVKVSVLTSLKGDVTGDVIVDQPSGIDPSTGDLVLMDGVPLLETGRTYLLATSYFSEKDWFTVVPGPGTILIDDQDVAAIPRSGDAQRRGGAAEPDVLSEMRDSIANEIECLVCSPADIRPAEQPPVPSLESVVPTPTLPPSPEPSTSTPPPSSVGPTSTPSR